MQFPTHEGGLFLTHNEHRNYYETVDRWLADNEDLQWADSEQRERAIAEDSVWVLQWYPDTPVGSCRIAAADLDVLLESVREQ